jgi:AraC-like DNA-binding protein
MGNNTLGVSDRQGTRPLESAQRFSPRSPAPQGLLRTEIGEPGLATMTDVFGNLRKWQRLEFVADSSCHDAQAARLRLTDREGHGSWMLYRLSSQFFAVVGNCIYAAPRLEPVAGEGFVEFHIQLAGRLAIAVPGGSDSVVVPGPRLLVWNQPSGIDTYESFDAGVRESSVTLYSRPEFLRGVLERDGVCSHPALRRIVDGSQSAWHLLRPLSPTCLHLARNLLHNPYRDTTCLLYAEAKALELLCEILNDFAEIPPDRSAGVERDERSLDIVRRVLSTQFNPVPRIDELARTSGMSKSKLKRLFKMRFGVTLREYGLECRMHHAQELLRSGRGSVSEAAHAAGYSHHTSFTEAFRKFFNSLPRAARGECSGNRPRGRT